MMDSQSSSSVKTMLNCSRSWCSSKRLPPNPT